MQTEIRATLLTLQFSNPTFPKTKPSRNTIESKPPPQTHPRNRFINWLALTGRLAEALIVSARGPSSTSAAATLDRICLIYAPLITWLSPVLIPTATPSTTRYGERLLLVTFVPEQARQIIIIEAPIRRPVPSRWFVDAVWCRSEVRYGFCVWGVEGWIVFGWDCVKVENYGFYRRYE